MDVRRRPVSAGLVTMALLLSGCGESSDDTSNKATDEPKTTTVDGDTEPTEDKPAKPVEMKKVKSERVADIAPLSIRIALGVEGGFIAMIQDESFKTSLVRIGADGKVGEAVPVSDQINLSGIFFETDAGVFSAASDMTNSRCGYLKVDPDTLSVGEIVSTMDGASGCSMQTPLFIDGTTAMFSHTGFDSPGLVAVSDTATGDTKQVRMTEDKYQVTSGIIVDGSHLVLMTPSYDSDTQKPHTADDGSALPGLLLRVDPASGKIDQKIETGASAFLEVREGQAVLRTYPDAETAEDGTYTPGEAVVSTVDPVTLKTEEIDEDEGERACSTGSRPGSTLDTGGLRWRQSMEGLHATAEDSCQVLVQAELSTVDGTDDNEKISASTVLAADGDDVLVLRVFNEIEDYAGLPMAVVLDRITQQ